MAKVLELPEDGTVSNAAYTPVVSIPIMGAQRQLF